MSIPKPEDHLEGFTSTITKKYIGMPNRRHKFKAIHCSYSEVDDFGNLKIEFTKDGVTWTQYRQYIVAGGPAPLQFGEFIAPAGATVTITLTPGNASSSLDIIGHDLD